MGLRRGREREGVKNILHGKEYVLATVEIVGHWRRVHGAASVQVPKSFAGGRIEREEIA